MHMHDWPRHTADLARAIALGDLTSAAAALDLIARDEEAVTYDAIASGRAAAALATRAPAIPELAEVA